MAKSQKTPQPPEIQAKSLGQIQDEAVTANISSLPKLLAAYQQYGPEFTKLLTQNFVDAQKRAPEAFPELYSVLKPLSEVVSTRLNKAKAFSAGDPSAVPDYILQPYREMMRGAQSARGMAESPISAYAEANFLLPYAENYISDIIGEGNSLAGTLNTLRTMPGSVNLSDLGLDLPNIGDSMNLDASVLMPFQEVARQQNYTNSLAYNQQNRKKKSGLGSMIGGAAGAVGGPMIGLDPYSGAQIGASVGQTFF